MKDLLAKTETKIVKRKPYLALESHNELARRKRCQQIFYRKATRTADLLSEAN